MARTIETIQQGIIESIDPAGRNLSTSKYAEWRLLSHVVAVAIHLFEVVFDLFRTEVEQIAYTSAAGTTTWCVETCRQWQYGHKLAYNPKTAGYGYAADDPAARIIKMVAINERERTLYIKVAKQNDEGRMAPLSSAELQDFTAYMGKKLITGTPHVIISTTPDTIRYRLDVYYDPAYPQQMVLDNVLGAFEAFKTSLSYDARFYPQQLIDRVMAAGGVVTVGAHLIEHKTSEDGDEFEPVAVVQELAAGYFEYDAKDNTITLIMAGQ